MMSGSPKHREHDSTPHLVAVTCGSMSGMYDLQQGSITVQSPVYAQVHLRTKYSTFLQPLMSNMQAAWCSQKVLEIYIESWTSMLMPETLW